MSRGALVEGIARDGPWIADDLAVLDPHKPGYLANLAMRARAGSSQPIEGGRRTGVVAPLQMELPPIVRQRDRGAPSLCAGLDELADDRIGRKDAHVHHAMARLQESWWTRRELDAQSLEVRDKQRCRRLIVSDCGTATPSAESPVSSLAESVDGPPAMRLFLASALHAGARRRRDADFLHRRQALARSAEAAGFAVTAQRFNHWLEAASNYADAFGRLATWLAVALE